MRFSQALELFHVSLVGEVSPRTREWYKDKLAALDEFADRELTTITAEDLRRWRAALVDGGASSQTLFNRVRGCKRFFKWLHEEGYISENPAVRLRRPSLPENPPKAITSEDLDKLIQRARANAAGGDVWAIRDLAVLLFLADSGCRAGGLIGLQVADLYLDRRRAVVREKGRGGQGKSRLVYFGEETAAALGAWLEVRPTSPVSTVFVSQRRRGPLDRWTVGRILSRLAEGAGVTGRCNPHSLRHAFALRLLTHGADLSTVSQLMGHSDITVTADFYARWSSEQLAQRHSQYSRLGGG